MGVDAVIATSRDSTGSITLMGLPLKYVPTVVAKAR
jgi:hypothetical protein